jgi:hypothetical protein
MAKENNSETMKLTSSRYACNLCPPLWLKFRQKGEEQAPPKAAGFVGGFLFLFRDVACASLWLSRGGAWPTSGRLDGVCQGVVGVAGPPLVEKPTATPRAELGVTQLQSERRHRRWVQRECHTPVTRPGPQSRRIGDNYGSQKASSTQKHSINESFFTTTASLHHHYNTSTDRHTAAHQHQRTTEDIEEEK